MSKDTKCVYEFGPFRVDPAKSLLFRDNQPISLAPKVFETLLVLVQHGEQVISKDELMKVLWPDTFVEEANLTQNISMLRKALGESPQDHRYIVTIPGRGYRFAESVQTIPLEKRAEATTPAPQPVVIGPGTVVSHYRISAKIASGGMGVVYEGEDIRLGRRVALKFLAENLAQDSKALDRFLREARAASSLNHPNICTIYEIEEHVGGPIIVMELLQGQTLREVLRKGHLEVTQLLDIAIQVSGALEAAHANGIIHRDIKPANIFITNSVQAKILDFGLAKLTAGHLVPAENLDDPLTQAGVGVGTTPYKSPEQARGDNLDARSDLFSLGIVLYEMATGQKPFSGKNAVAVLDAILHMRPASPLGINPNLPPRFDAVAAKVLEKDPGRRYQTAADLRSDLEMLRKEMESGKPVRLDRSRLIAGSASLTRPSPWTVVAAAMMLICLALGGWWLHSRKPHQLTEKDTIVLADFTNTTGDPVFDGTLRQGMAVQLEQSPFLSLVSDQRIRRTLLLMGRTTDAPLTPDVAREICERTASTAVLDGSIAKLGSQYVLGINAVNCRTGEALDEEQMQAARKEDVLNSLSQIASKFRTRIGESLTTLEKHNVPLAEATTPSLDALKAYSTAMNVEFATGSVSAVPLFQRAIEIDPKFALAYAHLGLMYSNIGESVLAVESTTKAYLLRDRASDRERFFITAMYYRQVTGNLEKAHQTLDLWGRTYPREVLPPSLLSGFSTQGLGKYEESIEAANKSIALDPDITPAYVNLAYSYFYQDRLKDATNTLQVVYDRKLEIPELFLLRYYLAFLDGDRAGMDQAVPQAKGKSGGEDWMSHSQALVLARSGRLQMARAMSRHAVDLAQQAGQRERAATFEAGAALSEAFCGNTVAARRSVIAALELSKGRDVEYGVAFVLALAGDSFRSEALANDLEKRFPEDTSVRFNYLPTLRARFALNRGDPAKAIELLQVAVPNELGMPGIAFFGFFGALYPVYVRGEAYLALHHGAQAAAEFQKILDHRGIVAGDPTGALAHLQLGRALAMSGDITRAKTAYQDFLTLWRDADPDIPILKKAKAECAKLQ